MNETRLRGRAAIERVNIGSKSERDALVLHSGGQRYVLRHPDEPSFGPTRLDHLAGHEVEVRGEIDQQYVFISQWDILDADSE